MSSWRAHDPETGIWVILVVDDSGDWALREFDWHGQMVTVPLQQALALIERRYAQLAAAPGGGSGFVDVVAHYGPAIAPRLTPEGVWLMPTPGRG